MIYQYFWRVRLAETKNQNEEIKNMSKLKRRITENGIDYILVGDYYIPDLKPVSYTHLDVYKRQAPTRNLPGRYGRRFPTLLP